MSSLIEPKKKTTKFKKFIPKAYQLSQNVKKNYKLSGPNQEHGAKNESVNNNLNNSAITSKNMHKLQEELNLYKLKAEKLEEEVLNLNLKIKEMSDKCIKNNEEEKNSDENSFSSQKINRIKKELISSYEIMLDIVEVILNQKSSKDKEKENSLTPRQMENNNSLDVYEQSVYNEEERKALLLEQIQQILIRKLNIINKTCHLCLEKQCERVKQWNLNNMNNKDISFSSFSAFSNNKKKNSNSNNSITCSDIGIGISAPHSPKFPGRQDSYSMISNIMDESAAVEFSQSIINSNNAPHFVGDSFSFEGENLSKSKEDLENKDQLKIKEPNLVNTSLKDWSLIRSGDDQSIIKLSFNKNLDKDTNNIEGAENEQLENQNKEIFIKNDEDQFNISFNVNDD